MISAVAMDRTAARGWWARRWRAVRTVAPVAGLVVVPAILWIFLLRVTAQEDLFAVDFHTFYADGTEVLAGRRPLSPYPPVVALLVAPLTLLPRDVADGVATVGMVVCAAATLRVLGVRDWRCYGAVALWAPVFSGVQSANVSLPLALAVAVLYRLRDRPGPAGALTAASVAVKLFLWPLGIWLAATRRYAALGVAVAAGAVATAAAWLLVGFGSVGAFVDSLHANVELFDGRAYTVASLLHDAGAGERLAYGVTWALGAAALAAAWRLGRAGDDARALGLAIGAALLLSPVVWLHYLVLLLVPVALARPAYSPLWLAPLPLWLCPVTDGAAWQKVLLLAVAAAMLTATTLRPAPPPRAA